MFLTWYSPIRLTFFVLLIVFVLSPGSVYTKGFEEVDLSLRLPAALSRFSSYADVAAVGGASAGSKWASSINPASITWEKIPGRYHLSLSPQYSIILFDEGTNLHVTAESITWDARQFGTIQLALAQGFSNHKTTRQDLKFGYDLDYAQIQWARHVTQDWALGGNFNFAYSKLQFDMGPLEVVKNKGESYDLRIGTLYKAMDKLLVGLVLDYGVSPGRTTLYDYSGVGPNRIRTKDTTYQFISRAGASYEYKKDSAFYFDYQFGWFSNDTGTLRVHRFLTGIDHQVFQPLFIRSGIGLDTKGNIALTCGIGIYPSKEFSIDIGYQFNMFPELIPEFGRSNLFTISIGIIF